MEFTLFFLLAGLIAVSVLSSFVAFLPPLHKWAQNSVPSQALVTFWCGFLAFAITFTLGARINASFSMLGVALRGVAQSDLQPSEREPLDKRISELSANDVWLLEMTPPSFRSLCVSGSEGICTAKDWKEYLGLAGISLLTAIVSIILAWEWLSKRKPAHLAKQGAG